MRQRRSGAIQTRNACLRIGKYDVGRAEGPTRRPRAQIVPSRENAPDQRVVQAAREISTESFPDFRRHTSRYGCTLGMDAVRPARSYRRESDTGDDALPSRTGGRLEGIPEDIQARYVDRAETRIEKSLAGEPDGSDGRSGHERGKAAGDAEKQRAYIKECLMCSPPKIGRAEPTCFEIPSVCAPPGSALAPAKMLALMVLSSVATLLFVYIFMPALWLSIVASDDLDPHESGLTYVASRTHPALLPRISP